MNIMQEFNASAIINVKTDNGIKFTKPVKYSHGKDVEVSISSNEDQENKIDVLFKIKTNSLEQAKYIAENELLKVANILSWEQTVPIKSFRVVSWQYSKEKDKKQTLVLVNTLRLSCNLESYVSKLEN